jgi:superoxide dismutase, Fe-Mn family
MFFLPELPFNYIDLEPYVDTQTVYIHHRMHHQTYINKLNDALKAQGVDKKPEMQSAMASSTPAVKNNAGGHYNHSLYWHMLAKPASGDEGPVGTLKGKLEKSFGSVDEFKRLFSEAAASQFGFG